jgi:hypothetical protein
MAPASEATYPGRNGRIAFNGLHMVGGQQLLQTEAIWPDGSGRRVLGEYGFPSWAASGRSLAALAFPPGELADVVFAGRSGRVIGRAPLPDTLPCGWRGGCSKDGPRELRGFMLTAPALSPDGRTVAFVQQSFDPAPPGTIQIRWIWTVRTDGSKLRRLALGDWPHWTPNGRRIVFQRFDAFGSIRSIASMRRDGTDRRRVLWTAQDETLLDVSPDGQRVLWRGNGNSAKGPQRWGLYTSDLRGHHIHLVHRSPPYPSDGCWSPDGKSIVFSRQGPGGATWIIPAAGGHKRRLLDQPRAGLAWQPLPPETNR